MKPNILIINPQHKEFIIKILSPYFNIYVATDKSFFQHKLVKATYHIDKLTNEFLYEVATKHSVIRRIALTDEDVAKFIEIQTFDNKVSMNIFLHDLGLKTIPCIISNGKKELKLDLPFIYKPVKSTGRIGFRVVENKEDLKLIPLGSLIQPKLTGHEYNLDILIDKGRCVTVVAKQKLAINAGMTSACKLVDIPQLNKIGKKLAKLFQITTGSIDVDVMEHKGNYFVIDINSRIGGGFPHSCNLCPKFKRAFVNLLLGYKVPSLKPKIHNRISVKESIFTII